MNDGFDNIIDLDDRKSVREVLELFIPGQSIEEDDNSKDPVFAPPKATPDMFPGFIGKFVHACCINTEAVPVAVATYLFAWFSSHIGRIRYLTIGDERRWLNDYFLLVGPSGMGKGVSGKGPARAFHRMQEFMEVTFQHAYDAGQGEGLKHCPSLKVHFGGLSSGEGLGFALDDGEDSPEENEEGKNQLRRQVTDKRILIIESELGNTLSQFSRQGNTLSAHLRNGYDGIDIRPLTKRDRVNVSDPYICLLGNITPHELIQFDENKLLSSNGLLNRMLMIWIQQGQLVPRPRGLSQDTLDQFAQLLAERIMKARKGYFETHWRNVRKLSAPIPFSDEAETIWDSIYSQLVNQPDCSQVSSLTRRHRLHARILSALISLIEGHDKVTADDILCALKWIEYSRQSVVYCYRSQSEQLKAESRHGMARKILYAIVLLSRKQGCCTRTDIHHFYQNKLKGHNVSLALETLLNWVPPLVIQQQKVSDSGRKVSVYLPTSDACHFIHANEGDSK